MDAGTEGIPPPVFHRRRLKTDKKALFGHSPEKSKKRRYDLHRSYTAEYTGKYNPHNIFIIVQNDESRQEKDTDRYLFLLFAQKQKEIFGEDAYRYSEAVLLL